jgi:hypothetical protein
MMNTRAAVAVCWIAMLQVCTALAAPEVALPRLQLPVRCEIGVVCNVQNYFDHDPGSGFRDYACGQLGYDGHDGTDIRVPNLAIMRRGVEVVAAAPGRVRAIRDEMPDVIMREADPGAIRGREAGNGVVLRHGNDWETQYSHMLSGSIRVRPGDEVRAGQVLGLIGLSGKTEFPHLHFEVRHRGKPVDPFVGQTGSEACGVGQAPLWDVETLRSLRYRPSGVLQSGFATDAPTRAAVAAGELGERRFSADAPAFVFWVELFGAHEGDEELLRLIGPEGEVLAEKRGTVPKLKALWLSYGGAKRRGEVWAKGVYRASYRLVRNGVDGRVVVVEASGTMEVN